MKDFRDFPPKFANPEDYPDWFEKDPAQGVQEFPEAILRGEPGASGESGRTSHWAPARYEDVVLKP